MRTKYTRLKKERNEPDFIVFVCLFVFLVANTPEWASQGSLVIKDLLVNAGDTKNVGLIPELGRSPGIENYDLPHCS